MNTMTRSLRGRPWEVSPLKRNVGGAERAVRMAIGIGTLMGASKARNPVVGGAMRVVGLSGLATGIMGFCSMNKAIGRDSFHGKDEATP